MSRPPTGRPVPVGVEFSSTVSEGLGKHHVRFGGDPTGTKPNFEEALHPKVDWRRR
jgi:hypothetical protein